MSPKGKILIVEDNPVQMKCIQELLKLYPYEIQPFTDVESAVLSLQMNNYDLVISDYNLPGKNGFEFSKILRNRDFQNPIIILTGNRKVHKECQNIDQSVDLVLYKPCTMGKINIIIDNYLSSEEGSVTISKAS